MDDDWCTTRLVPHKPAGRRIIAWAGSKLDPSFPPRSICSPKKLSDPALPSGRFRRSLSLAGERQMIRNGERGFVAKTIDRSSLPPYWHIPSSMLSHPGSCVLQVTHTRETWNLNTRLRSCECDISSRNTACSCRAYQGSTLGLPIVSRCISLNEDHGHGVQSCKASSVHLTHEDAVQDQHCRDGCVVWTSVVTVSCARSHQSLLCRLQPVKLPVRLVLM